MAIGLNTYEVDHNWVWGTKAFGDPVTLRAHLGFRDSTIAQRAVSEFFNHLLALHGHHGGGGWFATLGNQSDDLSCRVIDLTAGGQDVADAIGYAAEDVLHHFASYPGTTLRWEQMPY